MDGKVEQMRRKRLKKKVLNLNNKVIIAMILSIMILFVNFQPEHKFEALTIFTENQPIHIMYSLMMVNQDIQIDRNNNPINPYFHSISNIPVYNVPQKSEEVKQDEPSKELDTESIKEENKQEEPTAELDKKTIYLTFDDGPTPYTSTIVEHLNSYNMKATFFMLEPNMRMYPDKLIEIIDDGHAPALHGVTHDVSKIYRSEQTVVDEMNTAKQTLIELTGAVTHLIRTPYGSAPYMKPSYKDAVKNSGYQLWDWTIDSADWKYQSNEYVSSVIAQLENYKYPESPIVILLHDRKTTAEHLPTLLEYLKANGYHSEILTEKLISYHF